MVTIRLLTQRTQVRSLDWKDFTCLRATKPVAQSKLALLTAQQANESERQSVEARSITLFRKPADEEDGRLMFQSNHLIRVWMPGQGEKQ